MAANIERRNNKYSFIAKGEVAWHGVGTYVKDALTMKQVIEGANLDYEVAITPLHASVKTLDGTEFTSILKSKRATYRKDTGDILGIVGGDYVVTQNIDALSFFDTIIHEAEAIFETAGTLGLGEKVFVTCKLPGDLLVAGEPCNKYLLLTNSHDGTSGTIVGFTAIRVVCNNTLQAALKGLQSKVSVPHLPGAKEKLSEASKVMRIASKYMDEVEEVFNGFAKTKITDPQLREYITTVMANEKKQKEEMTSEQKEEMSAIMKNKIESIYSFALSHPTQTTDAARGTLWGAYNSISGYFNYLKKYKNEESKFTSQYFGDGGVKIQKAFSEALLFSK